MASLDILCSNPLNLKSKTTKIEHQKMFSGSSQILENFSWPINIRLKYFEIFHNPYKNSPTPRAPFYVPNVWFLSSVDNSLSLF